MTPTNAWEGLNPPYATIVADPPWPYYDAAFTCEKQRGKTRMLSYSTMTLPDIAQLPVIDLATPNALLFLWTTTRFLWDAKDVALGWGFRTAQVLVWCKEPLPTRRTGGIFNNTTEYVLVCRRSNGAREVERAGRLIRAAREEAKITRADLHRLVRGGTPTGIVNRWEEDDSLPNERDWQRLTEVLPTLSNLERPYVPPPPHQEQEIDRSWFQWPRTRHSEKPPAFLDMVEQVSPGPYVELFARAPRLGWDSWGYGYESERVS